MYVDRDEVSTSGSPLCAKTADVLALAEFLSRRWQVLDGCNKNDGAQFQRTASREEATNDHGEDHD